MRRRRTDGRERASGRAIVREGRALRMHHKVLWLYLVEIVATIH